MLTMLQLIESSGKNVYNVVILGVLSYVCYDSCLVIKIHGRNKQSLIGGVTRRQGHMYCHVFCSIYHCVPGLPIKFK